MVVSINNISKIDKKMKPAKAIGSAFSILTNLWLCKDKLLKVKK